MNKVLICGERTDPCRTEQQRRSELLREFIRLSEAIDPNDEYSDSPTVWGRWSRMSSEINRLRRLINRPHVTESIERDIKWRYEHGCFS